MLFLITQGICNFCLRSSCVPYNVAIILGLKKYICVQRVFSEEKAKIVYTDSFRWKTKSKLRLNKFFCCCGL